MTLAELKGLHQHRGESLRDFYKRFGEMRAQVHDITDREVIEAFGNGIFSKWQFKDFCGENPKTNEEFKRAVEKLISSEERTRHRFPDERNNPDRRGRPDNRPYDKRPRQENMIAATSNKRNFQHNSAKEYKDKKIMEFENMPCYLHPGSSHKLKDCNIFNERYKGSRRYKKEENKKEDEPIREEKKAEGDFQEAQRQLMVIYSGVPSVRSKQQEKLARRAIMAAEPATPRYLDWSEYPIQFTRDDQWTSAANAGCYPLVLEPTIAGVAVPKVLIDGGAGLNIIFSETLKRMKLDYEGLITPMCTPFYGIVPREASMPLGQITLPVTFGTPDRYRTELIKFEVAGFESCYHAILGRPALTKFMAVPHYPYLLLKMPTTRGGIIAQRTSEESF